MAEEAPVVPVPLASPLLPRSRGTVCLAAAPCAGGLPNDADTAHGAQVS